MTPDELVRNGPKSSAELIGKAAAVARLFESRIQSGRTCPIKLLCYGEPGVGKTAVCKLISDALAGGVFTRKVSAVMLSVDDVKEWMRDLCYAGDGWRVYWVEEVDAVSGAVEVLLLKFLDEMKDKCAALFTSNETMGGLSSRFQSRTQAFHFDRPSVSEVERFLLSRWPELSNVAGEIAVANNGDVRASLNDVQMHLDVSVYKGGV